MNSANAGRYLRTRLPILLAVVWLAAMAVLYYLIHNPLDAAQGFSFGALGGMLTKAFSTPHGLNLVAIAVGRDLLDALAVAVLVALGGGIGALILPERLGLTESERPILQALAGLGIVALVVLLAGMLGQLLIGWLATIALGIGLYRQVIGWARAFWSSCRDLLSPSGDGLDRWLGWATLVLLISPLLVALLPPFQWDSLTYHLAGPRLYLDAGRIISFPENHFLGFPQTVEMLYLWLMVVVRPNATGLLHWVFSATAVLLTISLGRRSGRPGAGTLAAIGLLVCDSLWSEQTFPYNDMALVAFVAAALCIILTWADSPDVEHWPLLAAAGLFVGLMMGTKYTAFGTAIGVAALVAWIAWKSGPVAILRACGIVAMTALIVFAPWLIKNAILDGNPLSPFVWGTSAFDHFDQQYYLRAGTGLNALSVIFAPIQATVFGREQIAPYGGSTGLLAFTLLPLALIGWRRRDGAERDLMVRLAIFAVPPYVIWIAGIATSWYLVQTRLLYPIFPALLVIGAAAVEGLRLQRLRPDPALIARLVAAAAAVIALWGALFVTVLSGSWLVELGLRSPDDYLAAHLGDMYAAFQEINALPGPATVQTLWEPRTYYCQKTCIPDSGIDLWWHDRRTIGDPHQIIAAWRARGVTHVLVAEGGLNFLLNDVQEKKYELLTPADVAALDEVRKTDLVEVWKIPGSYTLYRIVETSP